VFQTWLFWFRILQGSVTTRFRWGGILCDSI